MFPVVATTAELVPGLTHIGLDPALLTAITAGDAAGIAMLPDVVVTTSE
jgi:hypothetical protein